MDTMVYRFPVMTREIKMGAMLTVRNPRWPYLLTRASLPMYIHRACMNFQLTICRLCVRLAWKYGFNSPFKAEVYFVNTKQFMDQKWGTQSPVPVMDPQFGQIEIRAREHIHSVYLNRLLLCVVFGTKDVLRTDEISAQLRSYIIQYMKDTVAESKMSFFDLQGNLIEFADLVKGNITEKLTPLGLEMINLVIEDFSMPDELMQAYREGSKYNLVGGYDRYVQNEKLRALNTAAANEGGGLAGLGATLGAGAIFGNMMSQNQNPGTTTQTVLCPNCRNANSPNAQFCSTCGKSLQAENKTCISCKAEIPKESKFCFKCGAMQETEQICGKCGAKLSPGSSFAAPVDHLYKT